MTENNYGVAADQLAAYIIRVERLEEEVKAINDDKSEVYKEAKACGFDTRVMKMLIRRRRMDRSDLQEHDALLETYEAAMAMVNAKRVDKEAPDPLD